MGTRRFEEKWQLLRFQELGTTYGGLSGKTSADFATGDAHYVSFLDVLDSPILTPRQFERVRVSDVECQNRVAAGDVLYNATSETPEDLAMGSMVSVDADGLYLNSFCFGFRVLDRYRCDPLFLAYWSRGIPGRNSMRALAQGATRYNLSKRRFLALEVPVPSLSEQRAIAAVLSDVDELIGSLKALIAKKRAIKQATMQQLLTGRTRLPGFGGEWSEGRLGDIAQLHREHIVPDPASDAPYMHFSLPAYDAGQHPAVEPSTAIRSGKFRVPNDAILVSRLNPRIARVWAPTCAGPNAIASTEFLVLTPKMSVNRMFLYSLCSAPQFCKRMVLAATGTTGSHQRVNRDDAMNLTIRFPEDPSEQGAIATILSDMDAEIAALEHRLDKTHAIKQGMMQQLLTGTIRLPIPNDDTEDDHAHDV